MAGWSSPGPTTKSRTDMKGPKSKGGIGGLAHQPRTYPLTESFASSTIPTKRRGGRGHKEHKM